MEYEWVHWIYFNITVFLLLMLDLFVFHRNEHQIGLKESLLWSLFWIALALAFNALIYQVRGEADALNFFTGYVIEKSLSIDNLFVFLLIFSYFRTPPKYQHKVLFWGIVGAVVMRLIFIFGGIALINRFHWIIYLFGALLVIAGIKMGLHKDQEIHPENNIFLRLVKRFVPVVNDYEHGHFFIGKAVTPLFLALIMVETTDVIFAIDSIPAILAITRDPFIVYTSNICAILGLRSLYFALAHIAGIFHYLHYGLSIILIFIGCKMLFEDVYKVPVVATLGIVSTILVVCVIASILFPEKKADSSGK